MLSVWPPVLSVVVRRLLDAGLASWPVPDQRDTYEVLDGADRVLRIVVRGDGPPDLVERVWRCFDQLDQPPVTATSSFVPHFAVRVA